MKLSDRLQSLRPFFVMELLAKAKDMERAGKDVVHLEIGEPDFPTPPAIIEAGMKALQGGRLHYTAAAGLPELREAIAAHYETRYGVHVDPRRVFITPGASGALLLILSCLIEPGDEVLLEDPGYPCYANFVRLLGGAVTTIPVSAAAGFHLDLQAIAEHWRDDTRGAILASPANPTGMVLEENALAAAITAVEQRRGFLVCDEIYHGLEYDTAAQTALAYSDRVFVVNSFSKFYGMTGWRLGWAVVPEDYVELLERIGQNVFIAAPTHSQLAALAAFSQENLQELERRREIFRSRRDYLVGAIESLGFDLPARPQGAFYVYADCSALTEDSFGFAWRLLDAAKVAITPGNDFGTHRAGAHVRFSYTTSMDRLALGVDRLDRYLRHEGSASGAR